MATELSAYVDGDWRFARGLTRDLLVTLSPDDLLLTAGPRVGPFWKHFRHMGRVQHAYLHALDTGRVNFADVGRGYSGGPDRGALLAYLDELDADLRARLGTIDWSTAVVWEGDETVSVAKHLLRLVNHETLHHGMWLMCFRLWNRSLPASWAAWDPAATSRSA